MLRHTLGVRVRSPRNRATSNPGFTLIELLIVVVILGILAAIVVPRFSDAAADSKLSTMTTNLEIVRKQLQFYYSQHNSTYPKLTTFTEQLTAKTNPDGSAGGNLGPYLNIIPLNPFTDDNSLGTGSVGSSSWYYDENSGVFRANCHNSHTSY